MEWMLPHTSSHIKFRSHLWTNMNAEEIFSMKFTFLRLLIVFSHKRACVLRIIVAGQHSIKVPEVQEQVRKIEAVTVHEAYDLNTNYNDIALVRLENSLALNKEVHPPIFPEANCDATGLEAFLTGWGSLAEGGRFPDILQKTIVPIISNKECAEAYVSIMDWELPDTALCAGNSGGDTDACKGDSGGPLAVKLDNGSYIVVGLVSYGQGCAEGYPGVYAKLSSYINWINSNAVLTSTFQTPSNQED